MAGTRPGSGRTTVDRRTLAAAVLLVTFTFAAYLPALRAGFIWDDDEYITANDTLRSLDGLRRVWVEPGAVPQYYPLTFTSFWLEHHLWGARPAPYHAVNVLLHGINAVLLWFVLRRLRVPAAWMAAAVFAIHPMMVESVAWITERKNVLSGFFALTATLIYLYGAAPAGPVPSRRAQRRYYLVVCAAFVCALLSKTVTCSLPAVLLLVTWWKRGTIERQTVWRLVPLFAVGMMMAAVTVWMEWHHVGAQGAEWTLSFVERCLIAGRALWFYPWSLLWPHNLTFIYPRWQIDVRAWWQYLFPVTAIGVLATLYGLRNRLGRGALTGTLIYAGGMLPALGFVDVFPMRFSFVADHFAYLPSIGLIVLLTSAAATVTQGMTRRVVNAVVWAPILLVLAALTAAQCGIYRNLLVLWTDTLAKNPQCWMAHNNLGDTLLKQGDPKSAIAHFDETLRIKPDLPDAHYNLATALVRTGDREGGIAHLEQALQLKPDYPEALNNLGGVLIETGRFQEAIDKYTRALELTPAFPEAHNNLGIALTRVGRPQEAIDHFTRALRLRPDYPEAHWGWGTALVQMGQLPDAIVHFEQAVRLRPDRPGAHNDLGVALVQSGRVDEAIGHFEEALRLDPGNPDAQDNLREALAIKQRAATRPY